MFGLRTFTTTWSPLFSVAEWTCARDAAAKGFSSNDSKIFSCVQKIYFSKLRLKYDGKNDKTIIIKNIIDQGDQSSFLNYRNLVHCGKNVEIKILNEEIFLIDQCIKLHFKKKTDYTSNVLKLSFPDGLDV